MSSGRWPPLEERVETALREAGRSLTRREIGAALEAIPGNEWIVGEALEDLLERGSVHLRDAPDGATTYSAT